MRRLGAAGGACLLTALLLTMPTAAPAVDQTNTTTVDRPDVGKARASLELNKNLGQTTFLDRQITGLALAPNSFSATKVQRGATLDMYFTFVAGSLIGSRQGIGSEFADPILSQISAVQGKWTFWREGPFWPSVATGFDLNLDFNFRGGAPFSRFKRLSLPSFFAVSKTIYPKTGTYLTFGRYSSAQMGHIAYLTRFLDPKAASVPFAGIDFKVKDPSKGFRTEIYFPAGHVDGAKIMNTYIKAVQAMPLTLFTYARSDAGRAVALSFSFRYTIYPAPRIERYKKKRWWNPLSWYQDDNKNMAARYALQGDQFFQQSQFARAKKKYQDSLFLDDASPGVHYNMAMTAMQIGGEEEMSRAIFHFNRSIDLGGADASRLYALGLAYFKVGEKDTARQVWSDALKFDPTYSSAQRALTLLDQPKG